jgi:long-chain acyl-CoA synthetase
MGRATGLQESIAMTATVTAGISGAKPWLSSYPADVAWDQALSPSTLNVLFDQAVKDHAEKPCTVFAGRTLRYREIADQVDAAVQRLVASGVVKGTRVGLLLPNTPTYIVYFYAILRCGGVVVNYNPMQPIDELAQQVRDSGTSVMVSLDTKQLFDKVEALLVSNALERAILATFSALLPASKYVIHKLFKARDEAQPGQSPVAARIMLETTSVSAPTSTPTPIVRAHVTPDDLAVLQYTGGTTGTPKGARLTHANLTINTAQLMAWSNAILTPGQERILAVLPFFHVFAMTGIVAFGIAHGAEIVLQPRFQLDETIDLITRTRPTIMPGVPTLFSAIASHKSAKTLDLKSLKVCLSGGAGLPADVRATFEDITGAKLVEAYGLSETSPGATCNPLDGRARANSIGLPLPCTVISIRDPAVPTREMPLGQSGEICIAGPQVTDGYWNRPQDTSDAFVGTFLRTGDIGYMDGEGFVFVVDRIKDVIITSGFKVYPRHVEDKIYQHPAVEEVTVIGIKDAYRGEAPKAFVKLKAGAHLTVDELRAHLTTRLTKVEMPAAIAFRDQLPKTVIGKLSKKELVAEEVALRDQSS